MADFIHDAADGPRKGQGMGMWSTKNAPTKSSTYWFPIEINRDGLRGSEVRH